MKSIFAIIISALALCGCQNSPQMKVVISDDGETVGRYVSEDADSYHVSVQDDFSISKKEAHVEIWKASEGKGIITLRDFGKRPAFSDRSEKTSVAAELIYEEGYCPDVYPCLGYRDGWFQTEIDGVNGFVQEEYVQWDAINTY